MQDFEFPKVVYRDITAIIVSALPFSETAFWQPVLAGDRLQDAGRTRDQRELWHHPVRQPGCRTVLFFPLDSPAGRWERLSSALPYLLPLSPFISPSDLKSHHSSFKPYSCFWSLNLLYFHHHLVKESTLGEGIFCNMPSLTARLWKIITFDLN